MTTPDRIWIMPTIHSNGVDDFYLLDPEFRGNRGTEYVRADLCPTSDQYRHEGAEIERLVGVLRQIAGYEPSEKRNGNRNDLIAHAVATATAALRAALAAMEADQTEGAGQTGAVAPGR